MKLVSMIDFVFNMRQNKLKDNIRRFWSCEKYANFLNQPLNLSMFVPSIEVNGKWGELEEPNSIKGKKQAFEWKLIKEQYQQAKDKTLFKGFDSVRYVNEIIIIKHKSYVGKFHISCKVDNLIELKFLELTDTGAINCGYK